MREKVQGHAINNKGLASVAKEGTRLTRVGDAVPKVPDPARTSEGPLGEVVLRIARSTRCSMAWTRWKSWPTRSVYVKLIAFNRVIQVETSQPGNHQFPSSMASISVNTSSKADYKNFNRVQRIKTGNQDLPDQSRTLRHLHCVQHQYGSSQIDSRARIALCRLDGTGDKHPNELAQLEDRKSQERGPHQRHQ